LLRRNIKDVDPCPELSKHDTEATGAAAGVEHAVARLDVAADEIGMDYCLKPTIGRGFETRPFVIAVHVVEVLGVFGIIHGVIIPQSCATMSSEFTKSLPGLPLRKGDQRGI